MPERKTPGGYRSRYFVGEMHKTTDKKLLKCGKKIIYLKVGGCICPARHGKHHNQMNRKFIITLAAAIGSALSLSGQPSGREDFGHRWFFIKDQDRTKLELQYKMDRGAVDRAPEVDLPHDWGVDGAFDINFPGESGKLGWWGLAKYWKDFILTPEMLDGKCFFLEVDGAMSNARIYCNDKFVGEWPYGYSSFRMDLTPYLREGGNCLTIDLDNKPESSRWYPGGGIYRNVWLVRTDPVGIGHWGTYVTTKTVGGKAEVTVRTTLRNARGNAPAGVLTSTILRKDPKTGQEVKAGESKNLRIEAVTDGLEVTQTLVIENPALWSPETPEMYTLESFLDADGCKDSYRTAFGVRDIEFRADGFYLNGEKTFIKGVCLHHDAGALGATWNKSAWVRRLNMLKEMGCNGIRTAHNPPAPELLDLCDSLGFVVMDELTDTWTVPKKPNGYATLFDEWAEKDLTAMIRRDRNHPSVILWSIGNEVGEQGYPDKYHIAYRLSDICHREDPTRLTSIGSDNPWASEQDFRNTVDVYGFNYKPHLYGRFIAANPGRPVLGSETASTISSRGFYAFPVSEDPLEGRADLHVSSYDLYACPWSQTPDTEFRAQDENPNIAGEFVWTGFDYLGEPTPYNSDLTILTNFHDAAARAAAEKELAEKGSVAVPSRSSYFGIIDLAGFPKDRYWMYQARWRSDVPMAHILPHWNWAGREGEVTPVMVYTSGDSAELFVNGRSMGRKEKGEKEYRIRWDDVVYEQGCVEVVAYKDGREWARDKVETTGTPSKVMVAAETGSGPGKDFGGDRRLSNAVKKFLFGLFRSNTHTVTYKKGELVYLDVKIADGKGRMVPTACNDLKISVSGAGKFVAADAGDPTCLTAFKSTQQKAFNGLCSVIVRPVEKGKITVRIQSPGLKEGKIVIKVK